MSESVMFILLGTMMQDKRVNVSLTSGHSPKTMYNMMIPHVKDQERFKDIEYYLFDENPYIDEPINQEVPVTILKMHPNFTVICGEDAASLLDPKDYNKIKSKNHTLSFRIKCDFLFVF